MHQYKTITQILLFLNLVIAAPVVVREIHDTGDDVVVVVEDVATASVRQREHGTRRDNNIRHRHRRRTCHLHTIRCL